MKSFFIIYFIYLLIYFFKSEIGGVGVFYKEKNLFLFFYFFFLSERKRTKLILYVDLHMYDT